MALIEKLKLYSDFSGGIRRNLRSKLRGALLNAEEVDIFSNRDSIQPEQIMSSESLPGTKQHYGIL